MTEFFVLFLNLESLHDFSSKGAHSFLVLSPSLQGVAFLKVVDQTLKFLVEILLVHFI